MAYLDSIIKTSLDQSLFQQDGHWLDKSDETVFNDQHTAYLFEMLKQNHLEPKLQLDKGDGQPAAIYIKAWHQQIMLDPDNLHADKLVASKDKKHVLISGIPFKRL